MFSKNCVLSVIFVVFFYPANVLADEDDALEIYSFDILEATFPDSIRGTTVKCKTDGVNTIGNTKLKICPPITWRGKADRYPKSVDLFHWRSINLTAFDDNKTVLVSFQQQRAGFTSDTVYYIYAHLFDANYSLLKTVEVADDHPMIGCDDENHEGWHGFSYEEKLVGDDAYKYDDVAHIVYSITPNTSNCSSKKVNCKWWSCNLYNKKRGDCKKTDKVSALE